MTGDHVTGREAAAAALRPFPTAPVARLPETELVLSAERILQLSTMGQASEAALPLCHRRAAGHAANFQSARRVRLYIANLA